MKILSKPRTGRRKQPKFLGYLRCEQCRTTFMHWSDQGNTQFCSNICELQHERFDAIKYWEKHASNEATSLNGKAVSPLEETSREAD